MRATLWTTDLKCRYGGDEFLVILPETPLAGAMQVCESLHQAIEKDPVTWTDGARAGDRQLRHDGNRAGRTRSDGGGGTQ